MQNWKKYLPTALKRSLRVNWRKAGDILKGNAGKFALNHNPGVSFYPIQLLEQQIITSPTTTNKCQNLAIAIAKLDNIVIHPGEIFSFWKLVRNPAEKNGYLKSRSISGNTLSEETAGGICQLSGLIYFLALYARLKILERHTHSMDIYREEERFTPLGSDATVVYGYKDLRLQNPHDFSVRLSFELSSSALKGIIAATEKIAPLTISFEYVKKAGYTEVITSDGDGKVINKSKYSIHNIQ